MTDGEILMPTAPSEAWQQANILAMRQMGSAIEAQTKRFDAFTEVMQDMRDRIIRLEAQENNKAVEQVRGELVIALNRIDQLESQRDQVKGVTAFTAWLSRVGPWLLAIAASAWAGREALGK